MQNLKSLQQALAELTPQAALVELAMLTASLAVAYGLVWLLRGARPQEGGRSIWYGARLYDGVLFPLAALLVGVIARWGLNEVLPVGLLRLAVPILTSLVVIRLSVQVLRTAFPSSLLVRRLERTVSWMVWGGLVLWLTGALPFLMEEMEGVQWRIGGASVSLLMMLQGAVSAGAVLLLVLWLSATLEAQLLKGAAGTSISARKMAANATRAMLLLIGILVALTAVGIPISALSVLGGAIGVGIGLGLQKLASNYVSGFVVLAERSLRIGDLVRVDNFEGHITDIKTRYTVIRALSGRESIVPNEMLITQRVENLSLADRNVLVSTVVQVAYGTDLDVLMPELMAVARAVPRVLSDPGPGVQLSAFASDGLELTLNFWISDPENGQGNVRSAVNLAVLRALNERGIEIPFPQRVFHTLPPPAPPAPQPGNCA
jgi:small-conductance mechanosensitive channel